MGINKQTIAALEKGRLHDPKALVLHRTDSNTVDSALKSFERGVGTHFIVDKDGTIYQTASLTRSTYHVGPIRSWCYEEGTCDDGERNRIEEMRSFRARHNHEKVKAYPERYPMNSESIGIEVVAKNHGGPGLWDEATPAQVESIKRLIDALKDQYRLTNGDIYEHDKISYKTGGEGSALFDSSASEPIRLPPPIF